MLSRTLYGIEKKQQMIGPVFLGGNFECKKMLLFEANKKLSASDENGHFFA